MQNYNWKNPHSGGKQILLFADLKCRRKAIPESIGFSWAQPGLRARGTGSAKATAVPAPKAEADRDYFTASHYGPRKKKFKIRSKHPLHLDLSAYNNVSLLIEITYEVQRFMFDEKISGFVRADVESTSIHTPDLCLHWKNSLKEPQKKFSVQE